MLLESGTTFEPPRTTTFSSSLPKILHVIDKSSQKTQKTNSIINNNDDYRSMDHFLSEKWTSNRSETAISSPFRSNLSSASSAISSCSSSDHEINSDDVSPDSPDSGLSGSVNSIDEKCPDEELDFFYPDSSVDYLKSDSLFLVKNHERKTPIGPIIEHIEVDKSTPETTERNEESLALEDGETIRQKSVVNPLPEENGQEHYEMQFLEKQIEAVMQNIPKGFDSLVRLFTHDPENETDTSHYKDSTEDPNQSSSSSFEHESFIKAPDLIMSNVDTYSNSNKTDSSRDSFDWSIKTQTNATSDMQEMIKQIQLNARSIKINNASKKQTFFCQWHDCDWPGSYEDLADHLREIHVELQPFLDANGKVIKWDEKSNNNNSSSNKEDPDDVSSQTTLEDIDTEDEDCSTEDDARSSQFSMPSLTPRLRRLQDPYNHFEMCRSSKKPMGDKAEKFVCLWRGCKVFGKPSLSRHWIERHVLEQHSGPKPFKCIVDGCGQRFRTQNQLEKHVNMHFKANNQSVADLPTSMINKNKIPLFSDSRAQNESCCKCNCHTGNINNNCDMSTSSGDEPSMKHRADKSSRSQSVDSGISVQSGSDIFPSPSLTSLSIKQSEHCHTSCCCLSKSSIEGRSSKINKINKKKSSSVTRRTTVKCVANTDYLDDKYGLELEYEIKAREALYSNLKSCSSYDRCVRSPSGEVKKILPTHLNRTKNSDTAGIFNVFQKKLFSHRKEKATFESDVIACKSRSNEEFFYTLRWHPRGVLNNESVPEGKLETKRTCSVNFSRLRNRVQKSLDIILSSNRKNNNGGSRKNSRQVFVKPKTIACDDEDDVKSSDLKRKSKIEETTVQLKRKRLE